MKHELFQSLASVAKTGYRLENFRGRFYITDGLVADSFGTRLFLEEHINFEELFSLSPNIEPIRYTTYSPLSYHDQKRKSSLFLTFAEIKTSPESILEFANRFGLLFNRKIPREGVNFIRLSSRKVLFVEPLELWQENIKEMRLMVELWWALKARKESVLQSRICTKKKHFVRPNGNIELVFVEARNNETSAEVRITELDYERLRTDIYYACKAFLGRCIKRRLDSYDVPNYWGNLSDGKLKGIFERPDSAVSTATMIWNSEENRPRLIITPSSLLASIWLQFARAVDGDIEYKRCTECTNYIEISLNKTVGSRSDTKTCSVHCRKLRSNRNLKRKLLALQKSSKKTSLTSRFNKTKRNPKYKKKIKIK